MTDHQRARRAAKSKAFFARRAEVAALAGNKSEALRLLAWAHRKSASAALASAIVAIEVAYHAPPPRPWDVPGYPARLQSGEVLTMGDGARWFHPYSGGAPRRLAA